MISNYRGQVLGPGIMMFMTSNEKKKLASTGECNEVWDRSNKRRIINNRAPSKLGYTTHTRLNGSVYHKVSYSKNSKTVYIGTSDIKSEARKMYLDAFYKEKQRKLDLLK